MPSISHYQIVLDPHPYFDLATGQTYTTQDPVYRPGDWVSGHVIIMMNEKIQARAVRLWFQGLECVKIVRKVETQTKRRTSGRGRRRHTQPRVQYQTFINSSFFVNERPTLMGRPKNTGTFVDNVYLNANQHYAFPFQFLIPPQAPPTYFHDAGKYIKYLLYSNIDRPLKTDYHSIREIQVLPPLHVHKIPLGPHCHETTKAIKYLWLFNAGALKYRIQLMQNIVSVGSSIPIVCTLEPILLNVSISQISAVLTVKGRFFAQGQEDHTAEELSRAILPCSGDKSEYVLNLPVMQPRAAPPFTISGQFINFHFTVKVTIHLNHFLVANIKKTFDIQVHPAAARMLTTIPNQIGAVAQSSPMEMPQNTSSPAKQIAVPAAIPAPLPPRQDIPNYPQERDNYEAPNINHRFWPNDPPPPYVEPNLEDFVQ